MSFRVYVAAFNFTFFFGSRSYRPYLAAAKDFLRFVSAACYTMLL